MIAAMAMVLERDILSLRAWLEQSVPLALISLLIITLIAFFIGFLVSTLRYGPLAAVRRVSSGFWAGLVDLAQLS